MNTREQGLLDILIKDCVVATGCTEPIAVAYATSIGAEKIDPDEHIEKVEILVDKGLFKNCASVGIPGIEERGIPIAAALGIMIKNPKSELRILENITEHDYLGAKKLVEAGKIEVNINDDYFKLYIEVNIYTNKNQIRVLILDKHQNVVLVEKAESVRPLKEIPEGNQEIQVADLTEYGLEEIVTFIDTVDVKKIDFLKEGIQMGLEMSKVGQEMEHGFGSSMKKTVDEGIVDNNLIMRAQTLAGAASEARMSGVRKPIMTTAGSGNHGITVYMTIASVANDLKVPEEKMLRALALSNLITAYIKRFTGTLSAMCGCGVTAGVGASAGIAYMLGGNTQVINMAMRNMLGSITGMICDGGKEGCAYKVALSSGWAIQSALAAYNGSTINSTSGILSDDFKEMFANLGHVTISGMSNADQTIIDIIRKNEMC